MSSQSGSVKLARRYARALALLCDERADGVQVRADLEFVVGVLKNVPDAMAQLENPTVDMAPRVQLLTAILDQGKVQGTARNFALLMLEKGRIGALPGALTEFVALEDARSGRAEAQVTSATPLTEADQARIAAAVKRLVGKEIHMTTQVDPDLIGGLVVSVGNTVWDSSVRNHLNRLKNQLVTN